MRGQELFTSLLIAYHNVVQMLFCNIVKEALKSHKLEWRTKSEQELFVVLVFIGSYHNTEHMLGMGLLLPGSNIHILLFPKVGIEDPYDVYRLS